MSSYIPNSCSNNYPIYSSLSTTKIECLGNDGNKGGKMVLGALIERF